MDLKALSELEKRYFFETYNRLDVLIEKGDGCFLYTASGAKILDMFAGLAVNVLGYNHAGLNAAIEKQIKRYIHISNFFYQDSQIRLAEKICVLSGYRKVFFTNSGTEAAEAAIKLIRKHFRGTSRRDLISFSGSFHGRSMGALSLTARKKYRDDYHPFLTGVKHVNFNSVIELEQNTNHKTAGVFVECIQGEGGVNVISNEFANKLNELKEKYGFLLVADEIQSGVGRTGKLHSFEHFGLEPDIVIVAKGIGGGLPLGAVLGNDVVAGAFSFGTHGSTFGGNPVACACGLVVFERLENGLMDNAAKQGELLKSGLTDLKNKYPDKVRDVRGLGLMLGIEVKQSAADSLVQRLMRNDVLVNCTNGNVIRLLPPLIIGKNEADFFLEKLDSALSVPD